MKHYLVEVSKEWTEHGTVTVQAESEQEARSIVENMLSEGSDSIDWNSSNMDPGDERVESVTRTDH